MQKTIALCGKTVEVRWSENAERALAARASPLLAEMELYFSCLIRKKVRFRDGAATGTVAVTPQLSVSFRPVMTAACGLDYAGDEPPVTDFPIVRPEAFVPRWLAIDHQGRDWHGEFGF